MSSIGKNIKKIRSVKKLNQSQFAELFNISRASVGSYEEGRAEPKIDKILEIAKYFSIDLNLLLQKELTVNEISGFKLSDEKMLKGTGNNLIHKDKIKRIAFVNSDNKNDFINHLINKTPWTGKTIELPPSINETTEIAFVHNDNAMNKNNEGISMQDVVFAELIEIDKIFNNYTYIIITKDSIHLRKLKIEDRLIVLTAVDANFQPIVVDIADVVAVYKINAVIKKTINHFIN